MVHGGLDPTQATRPRSSGNAPTTLQSADAADDAEWSQYSPRPVRTHYRRRSGRSERIIIWPFASSDFVVLLRLCRQGDDDVRTRCLDLMDTAIERNTYGLSAALDSAG